MPTQRRPAAALGVLGIAALLLAAAAPANGAAQNCAGKPATIIGTEGPFGSYDNLRGTDGPDVMVGLGGNDLIEGLGGDDTLCGDAGSDSLHGGGGRDELYGGEADGSAYDTLNDGDQSGAADADVLVGNGNAQLNYHSRTAAVYVDLLDPGPDGERGEGDTVSGIYWIYSGTGDDVLAGTDRPNWLWPWEGDDTVIGRGGADSIYLAGGGDRVIAGAGNDTIHGTDGDGSTFICGPGTDRVSASGGVQGPWLSRTCESFSGFTGVEGEMLIPFAPPRPIATTRNGELTFRKPCPIGTRCRLTLTRPKPPFRRLATRVVRDQQRASLKLPGRFAERFSGLRVRVRMQVTGTHAYSDDPDVSMPWAVAWRFDLNVPPR